MLASSFNLLLAIVIVAGISFLVIRYGLPALAKYRQGEENAARHEVWLREQEQRDEQLRKAARQELDQEFGPVNDVDELQSKER